MTITSRLRHMSREGHFLTTAETAAELGVTRWWVRELIRSGELRAINVGGAEKTARWRVDPEDLLAFVRARENRPRDLLAG